MRYVVLVLLGIFSVLLNGSLFSNITVMGIQVDLLLLVILAIALSEKSAMPVIFAAAAGLLMDIMYSTMLGVYALSYTVVACAALMLFANFKRMNVLTVFLTGFGGYLMKETILAVIVYILGSRFGVVQMYVRYILPGALLAGGLLIAAYWLISKLMQLGWMRPRRRLSGDDMSHLDAGM